MSNIIEQFRAIVGDWYKVITNRLKQEYRYNFGTFDPSDLKLKEGWLRDYVLGIHKFIDLDLTEEEKQMDMLDSTRTDQELWHDYEKYGESFIQPYFPGDENKSKPEDPFLRSVRRRMIARALAFHSDDQKMKEEDKKL